MNFRTQFTLSFLLLISITSFAQYQVGHQSFAFDDASRNNRNVYGEVSYS